MITLPMGARWRDYWKKQQIQNKLPLGVNIIMNKRKGETRNTSCKND